MNYFSDSFSPTRLDLAVEIASCVVINHHVIRNKTYITFSDQKLNHTGTFIEIHTNNYIVYFMLERHFMNNISIRCLKLRETTSPFYVMFMTSSAFCLRLFIHNVLNARYGK